MTKYTRVTSMIIFYYAIMLNETIHPSQSESTQMQAKLANRDYFALGPMKSHYPIISLLQHFHFKPFGHCFRAINDAAEQLALNKPLFTRSFDLRSVLVTGFGNLP